MMHSGIIKTVAMNMLAITILLGFASGGWAAEPESSRNGADAGNYALSIQVNGLQRHYVVHVPGNHVGNKPLPVAIVFHGGAINLDGRNRSVSRKVRKDHCMQSWKFTIRPDSETGFDAFKKCKELGIVGIGWSHGYEQEQPRDYSHAKELMRGHWKTDTVAPEVETLFSRIQPGDHIWMHRDGFYYLCIAGTKHYFAREICEDFRKYDLGHAIEAKWIKVPDELVIPISVL